MCAVLRRRSVADEPKMFMTRQPFALSPEMVARELGIGIRRVQKLCRDGEIYPTMKIGRFWYIKPGYINISKLRKRGRPKGKKGPYPKGVKRPRKAQSSAAK